MKEKKPITAEEIEFLKSVKGQIIDANWCASKAWIRGKENEELKWKLFYSLLKDKFLEILKVESNFVTSYQINHFVEIGISETY